MNFSRPYHGLKKILIPAAPILRGILIRSVVLGCAVVLVAPSLAFAQTSDPSPAAESSVTNNSEDAPIPDSLRVATRVGIPPFVFEENGQIVGFSIDLWQKIVEQMGVKNYQILPNSNVKDLLKSIDDDKADLGIAAISITSEREKKFDFSYPMFESGLQIMVPVKNSSSVNFLALFLSPDLVHVFGIIGILLIIPTHIIWFTERGQDNEMGIHSNYFPGIFEALWWATLALIGHAEANPKSVLGRSIALMWMIIGIIFVSFFTANITTALTVGQLQSDINGPQDLPGKTVATSKGSTSADFLRKRRIKAVEVTKIDEAYDLLLKGKVDAIVFDSPVLLYYASHEGQGQVQVVGNVFLKEDYGIVFSNNNALRKKVNNALLVLRENGTYAELYKKWFANE